MTFLKDKIRYIQFNQGLLASLRVIFTLILLFSISNCKSPSYLEENICSEGIPSINKDKKGPITVQIHIDSVQFGDRLDRIDSTFTLRIKKESELISFSKEVAIKFFHIESKEYGNNIHELKYHVFIKHNNCWRIWTKHSRSISSDPKLGNMTFSGNLKIPEKEVFIKVKWTLYRIN